MIGVSTGITALVPVDQWILADTATPQLGKLYKWDDTASWTDANVWKD